MTVVLNGLSLKQLTVKTKTECCFSQIDKSADKYILFNKSHLCRKKNQAFAHVTIYVTILKWYSNDIYIKPQTE